MSLPGNCRINKSLRSASGELLLEGLLDDYRFQGSGLLESTGYPQLVIKAQGSGNRQRLQLQQLQGDSERGSLTTSGFVAWQPALQWQLLADVREFDPAFFVPGRTGKLSFQLQTDGSQQAQGLQGSLVIDRVAGTLQGQPVSGRTNASFSGNSLSVADCSSSRWVRHGCLQPAAWIKTGTCNGISLPGTWACCCPGRRVSCRGRGPWLVRGIRPGLSRASTPARCALQGYRLQFPARRRRCGCC